LAKRNDAKRLPAGQGNKRVIRWPPSGVGSTASATVEGMLAYGANASNDAIGLGVGDKAIAGDVLGMIRGESRRP